MRKIRSWIVLLACLTWITWAKAQDNSWMADYPYGQTVPTPNILAAGFGPPTPEKVSVESPASPSGSSAVSSESSISPKSAVKESHPLGQPQEPLHMPAWYNQPLESDLDKTHGTAPLSLPAARQVQAPWYDTPLGVLGIGMAATGVTMLFDHGINHYTETHIGSNFRHHVALNIADVITDGSLVIAGTTWFQSPWAGPKLARTSSVALTAAAVTTVEVFALKYAFGRARPSGPNSSSTRYYPFSSRYALFSNSFLFSTNGPPTASFPSGHTAIAFAVITPYAQNYHMPWLYTLPVLVGVSRIIAVDGHWASDVVAGGFLGWLTADLTNRLFPNSDYGFMIFGDGVEFHGAF